MNQRTRIISDVHFGHPASFVRKLEQLAPLLEGVPRVIFNGDSVEMRFLEERDKAALDFAKFTNLCNTAGTDAVFINGNHDPCLSDVNHMDLAGGAVLVTHGDILFHGLSPWSSEAARLCKAHTRELAALGNPTDLELRLQAVKKAALSVEELGTKIRHKKTAQPTLSSLLYETWPPWRPFRIINCWFRTPERANSLALQCRPEARFVIVGHMHWAGIWKIGGRVVINTGSFLPFSQCLAVDVDLDANEVLVSKVARRKKLFRIGPAVARFALSGPL